MCRGQSARRDGEGCGTQPAPSLTRQTARRSGSLPTSPAALGSTATREKLTRHVEPSMSLLTILWSWAAGVCSALAILQLAIWLQRRTVPAHAWLALAALGASANALAELVQLHAQDVPTYSRALILQHYPIFLVVVALVWFVDASLGTGRLWLARTITMAWIVTLVINQLSPPHGIIFEQMSRLERVIFLGEAYSVAVGTPGSWKSLPDLASLAFLVFVADAAWSAWQRGDRRRSVVVGGGILAFMGLAGIHSPSVDYGIVRTPYLISFAFLLIVLAMSLELSRGVVRVAALSQEIEANERRWRTLLENVRLLVVGVNRRGEIDYVNPFLREVTGFAQEELIGTELATIVPQTRWTNG